MVTAVGTRSAQAAQRARSAEPRSDRQLSYSEQEDLILARLKLEADDVVQHERDIAGYMFSAVLNHTDLTGVVVQRLASRLAHPDVPRDHLRQVFTRLVEDDRSIAAAIVGDLIAIVDRDPACRRFLEPILHFKGFHAIETHRFAHALWRRRRSELARYLQSRSASIFQTDIHPSARLGKGLLLDHATGLVVAAGVVVEDDVSLLHNVSLGPGDLGGRTPPIIRAGVSLGAGSKILGGIEIGPGVRVAAGAIVTDSVPAYTTVAGSPARIVATTGPADPTRSLHELLASKLELMHDRRKPHVL